MDEPVRLAMTRWPDVPACYGWLSLNQRGQWLLGPEREPIAHRGLNEFIGRNYLADDLGNWYCQNGPQKVYVHLDYTPWVFRLTQPGYFETHTGQGLASVSEAWLDEEGNLGLVSNIGPGIINDRDLAACLDHLHLPDGSPLTDPQLEALITAPAESTPTPCLFHTAHGSIPLHRCARENIAQRFGFIQRPEP